MGGRESYQNDDHFCTQSAKSKLLKQDVINSSWRCQLKNAGVTHPKDTIPYYTNLSSNMRDMGVDKL
jgi:hypothetical protein